MIAYVFLISLNMEVSGPGNFKYLIDMKSVQSLFFKVYAIRKEVKIEIYYGVYEGEIGYVHIQNMCIRPRLVNYLVVLTANAIKLYKLTLSRSLLLKGGYRLTYMYMKY